MAGRCGSKAVWGRTCCAMQQPSSCCPCPPEGWGLGTRMQRRCMSAFLLADARRCCQHIPPYPRRAEHLRPGHSMWAAESMQTATQNTLTATALPSLLAAPPPTHCNRCSADHRLRPLMPLGS
jgi:hypothetical protein